MKILFLLRKSYTYDGYSSGIPKAGLYNSAKFVSEQLDKLPGVDTKLAVCIDSNGIDREVHLYKPDLCVLEAIWVTPAKMQELIDLHPDVEFIIRVHSKIPFLANEGIAIERLKEFAHQDLVVSFNDKDTSNDFEGLDILNAYLPNIYRDFPFEYMPKYEYAKLVAKLAISGAKPLRKFFKGNKIEIGCFGAVRPMKNQLLQAVAAVQFARDHGLRLYFHVNGTRVEQGGDGALKNLRALFAGEKDIFLVEHKWLPHEDFLKLVSQMDIGLQVSFSESFNIISADFASQGVPIIVSEEVSWMPKVCQVRETHMKDIKARILTALKNRELFSYLAKSSLVEYNKKAMAKWLQFL